MKKVSSALIMFFLFYSCTYDKQEVPGSNPCSLNPSFSAEVKPFMDVTCAKAGCHATPGNGPGQLTTYEQIYAAKDQIFNAVSTGLMPKDGTLSASQKNIILCWIENGALNN